ncbi:Eukaryotic translation initiation factor 2B, subunit 4 delta, 67kDa [Globomyces sp. JEL0801]|nr:Eukaryotic translation initiation factor 2B, subunit 4 delta, 67kDa [Globomyces sp. JEL0801]
MNSQPIKNKHLAAKKVVGFQPALSESPVAMFQMDEDMPTQEPFIAHPQAHHLKKQSSTENTHKDGLSIPIPASQNPQFAKTTRSSLSATIGSPSSSYSDRLLELAKVGASGGSNDPPTFPSQRRMSKPNIIVPPASQKPNPKTMTKAERRELQEQQRAEKAARIAAGLPAKQHPPKQKLKSSSPPKVHHDHSSKPNSTTIKKQMKKVQADNAGKNVLPLFSHLTQFDLDYTLLNEKYQGAIHPIIMELGVQYREHSIIGGTARCLAMLLAFQKAKKYLCDAISNYIETRITLSHSAIVEQLLVHAKKIKNGDCVMTFARLSTETGRLRPFLLIVLGKETLSELSQKGLKCTYILSNAIPYVIKQVTKVMLGAGAVLSNGDVLSRCGTSLVCMAAHDAKVPVMVVCETYKFSESVLLDSIVFNEMGNPHDLTDKVLHAPSELLPSTFRSNRTPGILNDWEKNSNLKLVNLLYDITPAKFITMLVCEIGQIPTTLALRVARNQNETH